MDAKIILQMLSPTDLVVTPGSLVILVKLLRLTMANVELLRVKMLTIVPLKFAQIMMVRKHALRVMAKPITALLRHQKTLTTLASLMVCAT